jgi:hypothetical protein
MGFVALYDVFDFEFHLNHLSRHGISAVVGEIAIARTIAIVSAGCLRSDFALILTSFSAVSVRPARSFDALTKSEKLIPLRSPSKQRQTCLCFDDAALGGITG